MKIAILAQGDSISNFFQRKSHLPRDYDQVWGINQMATWEGLEVDKLFVMDDLKLRMPFYAGYEFTEHLKKFQKPIVTSKAYDEWPTSEDYPIIDVAHYFGLPLGISMYSTIDYMIALAIYEGATGIDLFGVDMMTKQGDDHMKCATWGWITAAQARGVHVRTFFGSYFQYITNVGVAMEAGLYGYAYKPKIEHLANKDYYQEWVDYREEHAIT